MIDNLKDPLDQIYFSKYKTFNDVKFTNTLLGASTE